MSIKTSIPFFGIHIYEPVTVITDIIISIFCFYYFIKLKKSEYGNLYRYFFLYVSLSTLVGSASHAFFKESEGILFKTIWITGHFLSALSIYYIQLATASFFAKPQHYKTWKYLFLSQLIVLNVLDLILQNFLVVVVNNALGLIPIMIIHFRDKKYTFSKYIGWGIATSFLTAFVFIFKLSYSEWFNHKDIAHVVMMISLWIMYRGFHEIKKGEY